tara:strand:- start:18 stop:404 length:387 start_codon:yes stop_codon:yes gene_type:complete
MWKDILKNNPVPSRMVIDNEGGNVFLDNTNPYQGSMDAWNSPGYRQRCLNAKRALILIMENMARQAFAPLDAARSIDEEIRMINNLDCYKFKLYLDKLVLSLDKNNTLSEDIKNNIRGVQSSMTVEVV